MAEDKDHRDRVIARTSKRSVQLRGFLASEDLTATDRTAIEGELEAAREYAAELLGDDD